MTSVSERNKAIFYIICSSFFFALMNMFVKMSGDLPAIQKSFFRNLIAALLAFIMLMRSNTRFHLQKRNLYLFILTNIF